MKFLDCDLSIGLIKIPINDYWYPSFAWMLSLITLFKEIS